MVERLKIVSPGFLEQSGLRALVEKHTFVEFKIGEGEINFLGLEIKFLELAIDDDEFLFCLAEEKIKPEEPVDEINRIVLIIGTRKTGPRLKLRWLGGREPHPTQGENIVGYQYEPFFQTFNGAPDIGILISSQSPGREAHILDPCENKGRGHLSPRRVFISFAPEGKILITPRLYS